MSSRAMALRNRSCLLYTSDVFHVLDTAKRYGEIAEEKFQSWGIPGRYLVFGDPKDLKGLMDKDCLLYTSRCV